MRDNLIRLSRIHWRLPALKEAHNLVEQAGMVRRSIPGDAQARSTVVMNQAAELVPFEVRTQHETAAAVLPGSADYIHFVSGQSTHRLAATSHQQKQDFRAVYAIPKIPRVIRQDGRRAVYFACEDVIAGLRQFANALRKAQR